MNEKDTCPKIVSKYKPPKNLKSKEHSTLPNKKPHFLSIYYLIIIISTSYTMLTFLSSDKLFIVFDIAMSFIYFLFIIELSRTQQRFFLTFISILLLTLELLIENILISYHLLVLFTLLPFILIVIANKYLLDIPYALFVNIKAYSIYNIDFFTKTNVTMPHHLDENIYIDIFSLSEEFQDEVYEEIKIHYIRLVKFWYTQKNYIFKLRYYFPLLALTLGISLFYIILFALPTLHYLERTTIMTIFLTIFYLSVTFHINSFLHSKFYMRRILKELNKTYYDNYEYRHQLKLFLDKNFLIYIHDKYYDRHICVNTNKDFQTFISKEKFDKEGRNNILTVFISFILILFIEVLVNVEEPKCQENKGRSNESLQHNK